MKAIPVSRINSFLFFIVLLTLILYFGREILVMVVFSAFLAMLMVPFSSFLERHKVPRAVSTLLSLLIILTVIAAVLMLIAAQIGSFSEDLPTIQTRIEGFFNSIQTWVEDHFGMNSEQQIAAIKAQSKGIMGSASKYLTTLAGGIITFIGSFALVLVFSFLFLFHREKYENFILMLYSNEKRNTAKSMLDDITKVAQQYLTGRAISIAILTAFYTIGLLIVGIKNAFLLGAIAAVITFIPYVGPIVGGMLPLFMALVTEDTFGPALGVIIVISIAQAFDNYFIEPLVVGGNVNISPFFTIFILIAGGLVWGIAGVILFLPLLGIVKIVFDNIEELQPYAYLIGDQKDSSKPSLWKKIKNMIGKNDPKNPIHKSN